MPLKKIMFKPGVNRENTRYTSEGGWYECDKIRFRQGTPEKIGGWVQTSSYTYKGICRSLGDWTTLAGLNLMGVGTNLKFYIARGGAYYDVTPLRTYEYTTTLTDPFTTTSASNTITVADTAHGAATGDLVYFSGSSDVGGVPAAELNTRHVITYVNANSYTITVTTNASSSTSGGGTVGAEYIIDAFALGSNPFATTSGSRTVVVTDSSHGALLRDFVSFSGATAFNSVTIAGEYQITRVIDQNSYEIEAFTFASATGSGGGSAVKAEYQINTGYSYQITLTGWGAGTWGSGPWGIGVPGTSTLRVWSQDNYGQNLVFGYRGSPIYYWDASTGLLSPSTRTVTLPSSPFATTLNSNEVTATIYVDDLRVGSTITFASTSTVNGINMDGAFSISERTGTYTYVFTANNAASATGSGGGSSATATFTVFNGTRAVELSTVAGASSVPPEQNFLMLSDVSRFLIAFGTVPFGGADLNPMLVRWSDQDNLVQWTPSTLNLSGEQVLSNGSEIVTAVQVRQEIVVFTNTALYSMQYVGYPDVWTFTLLGDNVSILSQNAAVLASGVLFWMGVDKFYMYDGRVQTLNCDLRQYVFSDINMQQGQQIYCGTNEGFNEVWWFYPSSASTQNDRYVVYNYGENIWYYGNLSRTAWLDSGNQPYPVGATTNNNLVYHEDGTDDCTLGTGSNALPISAHITSAQFDIDDGHNFGFVYRLIPDITFRNSSAEAPSVTFTLQPLTNSGSGINDPESVGGQSNRPVVRSAVVPVEEYTGQVYIRVRGRQLQMKVESVDLGVQWQLGAPRIDIRPDGRAGGRS